MASNFMDDMPLQGTCNDTISYILFLHDKEGNIVTDESLLQNLQTDILSWLFPYNKDYIWNNESFSISVNMDCKDEELEGDIQPHLRGKICVGDVIEDEWFTIYLLLNITKEFPGTVCRVVDEDGEFLLIEAADELPDWASDPRHTEQRVYLHDGIVHLIPPSNKFPLRETPDIMEAVKAVQSPSMDTKASEDINKVIQVKIDGYPSKIRREQHVCHAYVPLTVAALLREYPTLVAPAVHAFCNRDTSDNKSLRVMKHFPPETRVMTAVRVSKALYAQLMSRPYIPDVRTGWSLPPSSHKDHKSHSIGTKLACGFEILVCSAGGVTPASTPTTTSPPSIESDVSSNPRWLEYKNSLCEKGYFRGELEGSKLYTQLENNARSFFLTNMMTSFSKPDGSDALSMGSVVIKLMSLVKQDSEFYKERQQRLHPADDDSWLHITPDALDDLLTKKFKSKSEETRAASEEEMKDSLTAFFNHVSDIEGAEIPQELQEKLRKISTLSRPKKESLINRKNSNARKISGLLAAHPQHRKISSQSNSSETSNSSEMSSFSNKVDFNADSFTDALNNILEFGVSDDDYWDQSDEESSGMSSYGEDNSDDGNSRKSSNTSRKSMGSQASSGIDLEVSKYMKEMEKELSKTTLAENLDHNDSDNDEFDDVEDFEPVKVNMRAVKDLMKAYKEEKGAPGPTTALLSSIGVKPMGIK